MTEVTVATTEVFPLKKDEKAVKPAFKPLAEEKKIISQKTTEVITSSKKSAENTKKTKRERRDESSDSSDSDDGMIIY